MTCCPLRLKTWTSCHLEKLLDPEWALQVCLVMQRPWLNIPNLWFASQCCSAAGSHCTALYCVTPRCIIQRLLVIASDYLYLAAHAVAVLYSNCLKLATRASQFKASDGIALTHIHCAATAGAHVYDCQSESTSMLACLTQISGCAGLTQFQLMEDSAPATQTQKAVTDAVTKSTLSMIGYSALPLKIILTLRNTCMTSPGCDLCSLHNLHSSAVSHGFVSM